MKHTNRILLLAIVAVTMLAADKADKKKPIAPGIKDPGVQRPSANIHPDAVFPVPGNPDWVLILPDSVWIGNKPTNTITRLDPKTNMVVTTIPVGKLPCSGLAAGFGSVWVPNCGDKTLSRVDIATNAVIARIQAPPAESEGGIAASDDAIWLVTDAQGKLSRIDPKSNTVMAQIEIPAGSA